MHDPAMLEVFRHRVAAVADQMGATLQRAACSPSIKERRDFSCAIFDWGGRLLAQAAHIPVHLGAMPAAVAAARRHIGTWQSGDVIALNDPSHGGSHLPDITTVSPVFTQGTSEPCAFVATRAHHADVGGAEPGSLPVARELVAEGLVLPPVHLVHGGNVNADLMAVICANSRTPNERLGDLDAQLAAHRIGSARLVELIGADPKWFTTAGDDLLAYSQRLARLRLAALRDGVYRFQDVIDCDGHSSEQLTIAVCATVSGGSLHADFSGTAPQAPGGVNAPLAVTESAVYYVVACLIGDVPINAGTFAAVKVVAPLGCLLNPLPPAAVALGNVETSQRIVDVLLGALAAAAPDRIPAASQGTMNNVAVGGVDARRGSPFSYYETMGGGAGAGTGAAGASGLQVHMTNTRNTPVEALETAYPLRVEAYRLRRGSGGDGQFRGGDGLERELRFLAPARVTVVSERRRTNPWGLAGGGPGATGENLLRTDAGEVNLGAKVTFDASAGDVLVVRTPGGGGWGSGGGKQGQLIDAPTSGRGPASAPPAPDGASGSDEEARQHVQN